MNTGVKRIFVFLLFTTIVFSINRGVTFSQENKSFFPQKKQTYPRGAQYFLGTDDQLLIKVNIWGFVARPGQYLVPSDTDLISLISFAGGPRDGAKLSKIRLIRAKNSLKDRLTVIDIDVKKFIKDGDQTIIPRIKPGDTIIVSASTWFHINNFVSFITKIAALLQIYWWIVYYSNLK